MKMLNQLAIARIKKKLFAVRCLKKTPTLHVLSKVTILLLYNMKTATYSHLFNATKALLAYTLEIIIKEK